MKQSIKIKISFFVLFSFLSGTCFANIDAQCSNDKGKMSSCLIDIQSGKLVINYKNNKEILLNKEIPGINIVRLTGGEYSRRRIAESVTLGILLAPLALFGLFSKKKMDQFGVDYIDQNKTKNSIFIQTKKKFGLSLKTTLESVSGMEVDYGENKINGRESGNE